MCQYACVYLPGDVTVLCSLTYTTIQVTLFLYETKYVGYNTRATSQCENYSKVGNNTNSPASLCYTHFL